jgi:erythromycin esterase-like protein
LLTPDQGKRVLGRCRGSGLPDAYRVKPLCARAARSARYRYSCFEHFGEDTQAYGYAASFGLTKSCEEEVISQLVEMQKRAGELARRDGEVDPDAFFMAEQNARLVKNAERYYRSMFESRVESWNLRDQHVVETLNALVQYFGGSSAKIVVWAHNSHLGDARATQMGDSGESNISQLVREQYGKDAVLVGLQPTQGRSPPLPTGTPRPNANECARRSR